MNQIVKPLSVGALYGQADPSLVRDEVLSEIFSATARNRPEHAALVTPERRLTYAQADALSDAMTRGLLRRGIGPGDVVGLWLPRGIDLLLAQIAITKAGAAWLPFDADAPVERIAVCLADAGAKGLLTAEDFRARAAGTGFALWTAADLTDASDTRPVPARAPGLTPAHPAYLIYTSGSTGTPKGIVISHRNICHYLRAANTVFGLGADDVVFQGASVAFDLSMEEIWIPYLVGATLRVASTQEIGDAERLPDVLEDAGVTVLDTVPTLLGLLGRDVPSLRVIILGGEACPPSVAARWSRPGRRIFNSYGPTETTVVATVAEVRPDEPVTIGRPIPNYSCYVVDENLAPVPPGAPGELLIGGPGVAGGYLGRPELTAQKFIANPFRSHGADPVLYRSGDAVSLDSRGNLLFHGRIDDQVKIRGFRVELGEIEAKLAEVAGVARAAVVMRQDEGLDRLVAFLVPERGESLDRLKLRLGLRDKLPSYMVPSHFELVDALPRLASGKIDRKALRAAPLTAAEAGAEQEEPRSEIEAVLLAAAKTVFPGQAIPFDADFFTELGGHSLLAARFVSEIRRTPALAGVTLQDVYAARTLRALATRLDARGASDAEAPDLSFEPPPFRRRFLCGLAQAVALPFILGLVMIEWLGVFLASIYLVRENASIWQEMAILLGVFVFLNFALKFVVVALKWLILGRTKPGRYPLWGVYFYRVWLAQRLTQIVHMKFMQGSPLMRVYLRALGARIGRDAIINEFEAGAIDLISIGDGASLGLKTKFANVEFVGNEMVIGRIDIGPDVHTGNCCVLGHDTRLEQGAEIGDLTAVLPGTVIGAYESWDGSPARKVGMVDLNALPEPATASTARRVVQNAIYTVSYILVLMLGLLPIFPAFYVLYNLDSYVNGAEDYEVAWSTLPLLAWPTALALIVISMAIMVAIRWILLPRVSAGTYSIHSWFYLRKWIMGLCTEVTLETLSSLYATVYMRVWYRMLGARIGKGSEISTNLAGRYDLVEIGANNFLGDEVVFGDEDIRRGWMTLKTVKTGDRVFFGNDAVVAPGAVIEDGALIGVKSRLPESLRVGRDEIWFGSPAMKLPNRQKVDPGAQWTYEPSRARKLFRALFEALHTSLPTALVITCGYITADVMSGPLNDGNWLLAAGVFFAAGVVIAAFLVALVALAKWGMMGVYKPTMKPMWSFWAMRTEAVAVLYAGLSGKASSEFLRGTPFLPWVLRIYGAKIGRGVFMDMVDVTEFDCIRIGDFAVLNMAACLQTHLYEDRVMKVGRVTVGKGVTVGAAATVLYDTAVGDYARLSPLTVVMKGESIPPGTAWCGAPAQPVMAPAPAAPRLKAAA